ncbi:MAG: MFS transporter, partial [Myxococcota bacterium]|nr:MFS transporter [Myxococcota bacterium]
MFSVVVIDLIGFGVVLPILPFYADAYGATGLELGLLFMVYAAAQFACAPLWGRASDRFGRRPVMLVTISGTAGSLLLLGLADSLVTLFVARALGGIFAANVSVASAYITDVTEEVERTRWMGVLGACFGVGFVLGPALGGALAPFGYSVPMLVAAGLAAANAVHAAISLREPPRHADAGAAAPRRRLALLRDPLVRRLCLLNLAFSAAVTQLEVIFAWFMKDRFGWDVPRVAVVLVGMAVLMGGVQGGGMKALAARFPERSLAMGGSVVLAVSLAAVPAAPGIAWLVAALAAAAVGRAVVQVVEGAGGHRPDHPRQRAGRLEHAHRHAALSGGGRRGDQAEKRGLDHRAAHRGRSQRGDQPGDARRRRHGRQRDGEH